MISFIPGPIKRYRRLNPYNNPLLFLFVDGIDTVLQLTFFAAIGYWAYTWIGSNSPFKIGVPVAIQSISTAVQPTEIPASAITKNVDLQKTNVASKPRTLLQGKHARMWINSQPQGHYTVQFGASTDKNALIDFANAHLTSGAVIYPFKRTNDGKIMYGVSGGLYKSLPAALRAIEKMPKALVSQDPWIRQIEKLKIKVQGVSSTAA